MHGLRGGLDPVLVRLRVQLGFRLAQLRDRLLEVLQRLERPVDRGEPQVGDQIQLPQRPEYASPTSWVGSSATPEARTASSTRWASSANWSSVTGRPWQALRTPATTLSRLNGSVTPDRLTTSSVAVSIVVNRRPHSGQERRRRMAVPSSVVRESITFESV